MSDRGRRKTIKPSDLRGANSELHHSDIPAMDTTPSTALSNKLAETYKDAVGTKDEDLSLHLVAQTLCAIPGIKKDPDFYEKSVMATLRGIGPKDELEGLLAAQMVAVHHLAMNFLASASPRHNPLLAAESYLNRAVKLLRIFTSQMEALNRHRGNIGQQMVVGNVNINDGGQAIVGPVKHPGPGKVLNDNEEQKGG